MRAIFLTFLASLSPVFSHPISSADPWTSRVYVGANAGTLGARGEVGYYFNDTLRIRFAGGGFYYYKKNMKFEGVDYHNVKIRPMTFMGLLDWYFLKGWGFRITGGIGYNRNKITLHKTLTMGNVLGNDDVFYSGIEIGRMSAKYRFRRCVPYLGGGYDTPRFFNNHVSLNIEAGALFQGRAHAKVKATGMLAGNPAFQRRLKEEAENLMNTHKWIKVYPVVMVGVNFHFT
jgi:hypothetical protein